MKILTGRQIREADKATIERESISSLELMERAAEEIARRIAESVPAEHWLVICCGKGGNGGDGLAVTRILANAGRECMVLLGADRGEIAGEARINLERLPKEIEVYDITVERPDIEPDAVIVDALLGVGVTGEVREPVKSIVRWMNSLPNRVISIDIPSGMSAEWRNGCENTSASTDTAIVRAETTLTLEFPKFALLVPETGEYAGRVEVLSIGLDEKFIAETVSPYYYITEEWVESLRLPRAKFSHKGSYGHALLVCGSTSMPGAAILATGGALRSGCGLVTAHIPKDERFAFAANHPSAMLSLDIAECFSTPPDRLERFSAIGVGCGLGRDAKTTDAFGKLFSAVTTISARKTAMVLDADALNIISENPRFKQLIPAGSVMTPHPGELRRLTGEWRTDKEKLEKASKLAAEIAGTVIVKGAHSVVCTSDGRFLFNSTGTPGMAKGGSGDVLTGLITGLMARGYDAETASVIAVYDHGRAGERAAELYGVEAMNSADLAEFL